MVVAVVDEQGGSWGANLQRDQADQGKEQGDPRPQAEGGPALLLLTGGVVVGQQGEQAVGHADGKVEGELVQLLHNAQGGHSLGGVLGDEPGLGSHRHHRKGILQGRGEADG